MFALSPGPNDLSLFQPKCPETREMGSRLLVYYHAKACRHTVCMNLSPSSFASSPDSSLDGHFTGQYYVTRDVKVHIQLSREVLVQSRPHKGFLCSRRICKTSPFH